MASPVRRPFTGSCHCGATRYVLFLTLPHSPPPTEPDQKFAPKGVQNFYRCNCTLCHKAGLLHIRPRDPTEDFFVVSPLDPLTELGDYVVPGGNLHFLFCKGCGMRCFSFRGESDVGEVNVRDPELASVAGKLKAGGAVGPDGELKVWRPRKGKEGGWNGYLSINAHSLDANQEGADLREWTEKKWVLYLDYLELDGEGVLANVVYERPQVCGAY